MDSLQRRRFIKVVCTGTLAVTLLGGCSGGSAGGGAAGDTNTTLAYDFNAGMQGWVADFSDLPENYESMGFDLAYTYSNLPAPLDTSRKALSLTSHNRSDDLWYFLKRQVTGLKPNTRYRVGFDVEIASNAPESAVGIGGGPGTSVVLKAGASAIEPAVTIGIRNGVRSRVFTLDKGEQSQGGSDVIVLGNIAIAGDQQEYRLKPLGSGGQNFFATSDSLGRLWAFFGSESGFEGLQTLYYTRFKLTLTPG